MPQTKKWLAALAAGGSTVGAAVALSNAPAASPAAKAGSVNASLASLKKGTQDSALAAAVAQANHLQTTINDLRKQLLADEHSPMPAGGTRVVVQLVGGRPVYVTSNGSSSAIAAQQARINSEQAQLQAEQNALTGERNSLASDAAQLQSEQAQLQKEQESLASRTTATTAPSTHTTTGASGSTSAVRDD